MKVLILLGLLFPYLIFAQIDMIVIKNAGGHDDYQIVNNDQITFQNATASDVMYVKKKDGTTDVYKLSEVNLISFDGITGIADIIPNLFKLENYPNPFELKTTIAFALEKSGRVELSIFDLNGIIIKSLVNDNYEAGKYRIEWDGTNSESSKVSAGIYFYQLKVQNIVTTKQMITSK